MYTINYNFTYRQKDKGWQVILSYKDGDKWRQKSKQGLKTKQLAKAAGEKLLDELNRTFVPTTENEMTDITLREFLPVFLKDKPHLTHSSIYAYGRLPVFFSAVADEPLRKLTAASIRSILMARQSEFSAETIRQRTTLFACVLSHAIHTYGILRENPVTKASRIIRGQKKRRQIRAISKADFEKLMQSKVSERHEDYKIIVLVAYYTGMRYGEILGLSWNDVDFAQKEIKVRQQLKRHSAGTKYFYKLGALKTQNSYRTIPIPDILAESLKEWHLKSGQKSVISVNNSSSSAICWIRKTLPQTTIHDFRHTYATNLLANGLDIQTVAALCGDTVGTIIKTYIDYTGEMRKKAAKDIDRIF